MGRGLEMRIALSLLIAVITLSSGASAQSQPRSAQVNLYFPHFVNGPNPGAPSQKWQTTFTFVNVGVSDATVVLYLYNNVGLGLTLDFGFSSGPNNTFTFTVPANGITILKSQDLSTYAEGWAIAYADVPVQASAAFRMLVNGVPQQEVTAQPTLPTLTYTSAASAFLGVALANPYAPDPLSDQSTYVDLSLYDSSGTLVASLPNPIKIPPYGHTSFNLWQMFPGLQTNTSFTGVLEMTGHDPTFPDRFVGWTLNSDASTILSMQPPGDFVWPISHLDRIWQVWSIVLDAAAWLDPSFYTPSWVGLNILPLSNQRVDAFVAGGVGAQVDVTYGMSELINDSDSEMAYVFGHMLGHVYQQRNSGAPYKYISGSAEADADQWALAIMLEARYDPYSLPGALAKLAMATNNSQLTTSYDGLSAVSAYTSLNVRLGGAYGAIQAACNFSQSTKDLCASYKSVVHPGLPQNAPLGIRRPVGSSVR